MKGMRDRTKVNSKSNGKGGLGNEFKGGGEEQKQIKGRTKARIWCNYRL